MSALKPLKALHNVVCRKKMWAKWIKIDTSMARVTLSLVTLVPKLINISAKYQHFNGSFDLYINIVTYLLKLIHRQEDSNSDRRDWKHYLHAYSTCLLQLSSSHHKIPHCNSNRFAGSSILWLNTVLTLRRLMWSCQILSWKNRTSPVPSCFPLQHPSSFWRGL